MAVARRAVAAGEPTNAADGLLVAAASAASQRLSDAAAGLPQLVEDAMAAAGALYAQTGGSPSAMLRARTARYVQLPTPPVQRWGGYASSLSELQSLVERFERASPQQPADAAHA